MLLEKENAAAKYTAAGKRKIKAKVLSMKDKSLSIFNRSASIPQAPADPGTLDKLRFRMTKSDFRKKGKEVELPFKITTSAESTEQPQERERNLPMPGEEFQGTTEDFRKKKE